MRSEFGSLELGAFKPVLKGVKHLAFHGFFNLVVRGDLFVIFAFVKVPYPQVIVIVEGHIIELISSEVLYGVELKKDFIVLEGLEIEERGIIPQGGIVNL